MKTMTQEITYKNIKAGYALVEGWMIDTKDILTDFPNAHATKIYNNKRNYTVSLNGAFIGEVCCMAGGRYAAVTADRENIFSTTGYNAPLECFIEMIVAAYKG